MTKLFECYVARTSHDEAVEIVERLIANGAKASDVVDGMDVSGNEYANKYANEDYKCWGYKDEVGTFTGIQNFDWEKRAKKLTMPEFRAAFPCDKYDSVVETTEEWPQPGDKVVVDCNGDWEAIFIGKSTAGAYVCQMPKDYQHGIYDGFLKGDLSKPKSDREKFIEAALNAANKAKPECDATFAGALYDAGFKAPEDK